MGNYTIEQISTALSGRIMSVADVGVVIDDPRFVEEETEVAELVESMNPDKEPTGWVSTLVEITNTPDENPCVITVGYKFELVFLLAYKQKRDDGLTSKKFFERKLFEVNEALNFSRALGLDNRVEHQCLQSEDEFGVVDWGGDHGSVLTHFAKFSIVVEVQNRYE